MVTVSFAERPAHADNRTLVLFDPCLPAGHAFAFLGLPLVLGKRGPCGHLRTGFAAEKNSQIRVGAHEFPSVGFRDEMMRRL